ncbi:hypothetical protein V1290_002697 [Bradyrhizobium sp. AZCC 1578]
MLRCAEPPTASERLVHNVFICFAVNYSKEDLT